MIVLENNPADNLEALRNVSLVIKNGKSIKGKIKKNHHIDALLDSIL